MPGVPGGPAGPSLPGNPSLPSLPGSPGSAEDLKWEVGGLQLCCVLPMATAAQQMRNRSFRMTISVSALHLQSQGTVVAIWCSVKVVSLSVK